MAHTYTFHSDAGHGWLEVDFIELVDLAIADDVSAYSYRDGDTVYLEEDCDAARFMTALEEAGEPFAYREVHDGTHSPIRDLPRYSAERN